MYRRDDVAELLGEKKISSDLQYLPQSEELTLKWAIKLVLCAAPLKSDFSCMSEAPVGSTSTESDTPEGNLVTQTFPNLSPAATVS